MFVQADGDPSLDISAISDYAGDRADSGLGTHLSMLWGQHTLPMPYLRSSRIVQVDSLWSNVPAFLTLTTIDMALPLLVNLYRLVCILCLFQFVSGVLTIRYFGLADSGLSQLFWATGAGLTLVIAYRLLQITRRPEHRLARVDRHVLAILLLVAISIFYGAFGVAFLVPGLGRPTVLAPCFAVGFMSARCVPVALDIALPGAVFTTLTFAIVRIRRRASTIYGDEMVLRPVTPTLMPAWELGNVAEMERAEEESELLVLSRLR
ncbi:hypothetical protein GGX14DRAFT_573716 [Mycena pura]|uniref:Uncharacterized protein n=1 Tax=Mycena pura TaxID=153505 RepID=A0AAD6UZB9_9AGAR|nr:hypothetical protein GGX14DRAFT_573716 [Mycena pura]